MPWAHSGQRAGAVARHPADRDQPWRPGMPVAALQRVAPPVRPLPVHRLIRTQIRADRNIHRRHSGRLRSGIRPGRLRVLHVTTPPGQPPVAFELQADPSMAGGVYANALAIWHTAHEFTLDFMVNAQPPSPGVAEDGTPVIRLPHRLVARVRIPPGAAFDVIRAINENMTRYEQAYGPIHRPGKEEPLYPPPELGNTGDEPPH
jgi:Protein of unknown function (DUF3467)